RLSLSRRAARGHAAPTAPGPVRWPVRCQPLPRRFPRCSFPQRSLASCPVDGYCRTCLSSHITNTHRSFGILCSSTTVLVNHGGNRAMIDAPLALYQATVPAEWVDYNGHMSEWCYLLLVGDAADKFFRFIGIDEAYRAAGQSLYTAETHLHHLRE